jgi:nitroimidazol reductase NimA-like FMN-containing flavoprotein (pyridoxamine 5'-phosphate oxidase superfamily)
MASWGDIEPAFAARAKARLDAHVHKTLATLRADGSPRISGIETFWADGELWFGSMPDARKALDLRRDPRYALHGGTADPPEWEGDVKLSGRAEELTDPERRLALFRTRGSDPPSPEAHLFRADIDEAVLIGLNDERTLLVIELWRPGQGVTRMER